MGSEAVILEVYLIRHAESAGNVSSPLVSGVDYPFDDPPLTPHGIVQAELLGERMSLRPLDAIISSTLTRAVHTAHEVAKRQQGLKVELWPDLMETDTAPGVTGCTQEVLKNSFPLALPCLAEPTPAGGTLSAQKEDFNMKIDRAKRCIDCIRSRYHSGERVAVITHGGFFGHLMCCALGLPAHDLFRWSTNNTSVTKIKYYADGMRKLSYSNDTSHLYAASPDMTYTI